MPVRKHGNGWEVRVQHAGRRFSRTVGNRKDAQELERTVRSRLNDSALGRTPRYTLEEALTRWLTHEAASLKSLENLKDKLRTIYKEVQGRSLSDVVDVAEQVKAKGLAKGLKPATINRRLAILRRVARLAFRTWEPAWLDRDLGAKIKLLPGEEPRYEQASPETVKALIKAAGERAGAAIEFAALTGLRRGELLALKPENVSGGAIVLTHTKTGRPRTVPLAEGLTVDRFPWGITEQELRVGFEAARKAIGRPDLQFRDLRRTFGSWIIQRTQNLKLAQDLLGHTTQAITARHYAHMLDDNKRDAVNTLPRFSRGRRGAGKTRKKAA